MRPRAAIRHPDHLRFLQMTVLHSSFPVLSSSNHLRFPAVRQIEKAVRHRPPNLKRPTRKPSSESAAARMRSTGVWSKPLTPARMWCGSKAATRSSSGAARSGRSHLAARCALSRTQDRGTQARARQAWLRRSVRRHPTRRGGNARERTGVFAARGRGFMERARSAAGVLESLQCLAAAWRASSRPSDPALDRKRHLALHPAREHPDHSALPLACWQTVSLAGRSLV